MNKDQRVMVEKRLQEFGWSILNSLVMVTFDVRVGVGQLLLLTSVNGNLFRLSLPMDSDGLKIAAHVERNLVKHVNECVKQLVLKTSRQKRLRDITKKGRFYATRINFIQRCLQIIAQIRKENPEVVITQQAVAALIYPKSLSGANREAQFSQDLKRKQISFEKLKDAGKLWEELTSDEMTNLIRPPA